MSIMFGVPMKYWNEVQPCYSAFTVNSQGHVQPSAVMVYQASLEFPGTMERVGTRASEGLWEHQGKRELMALMGPKAEKASRPRPLRETGNNARGKMLMMEETMD